MYAIPYNINLIVSVDNLTKLVYLSIFFAVSLHFIKLTLYAAGAAGAGDYKVVHSCGVVR